VGLGSPSQKKIMINNMLAYANLDRLGIYSTPILLVYILVHATKQIFFYERNYGSIKVNIRKNLNLAKGR